MASFLDVMLQQFSSEFSRRLQMLLPSTEMRMDHSLTKDRQEAFDVEGDLPNRVGAEIQDCENFENFFLIDKMLGEFVPL